MKNRLLHCFNLSTSTPKARMVWVFAISAILTAQSAFPAAARADETCAQKLFAKSANMKAAPEAGFIYVASSTLTAAQAAAERERQLAAYKEDRLKQANQLDFMAMVFSEASAYKKASRPGSTPRPEMGVHLKVTVDKALEYRKGKATAKTMHELALKLDSINKKANFCQLKFWWKTSLDLENLPDKGI